MNTVAIDDHYIAHWLLSNPDFFVRQGEILADLKLTSPYSHRAISLQERQLEILREKVHGLELRLVELLRYGHENDATLTHLHRWLLSILAQSNIKQAYLNKSLCDAFALPCTVLQLWSDMVVPSALQKWVERLVTPCCGNVSKDDDGQLTLNWLSDTQVASQIIDCLNSDQIASIALIPLHTFDIERGTAASSASNMGLLILAAYDERRFSAEMGTLYLTQIGELVSAALARFPVACEED